MKRFYSSDIASVGKYMLSGEDTAHFYSARIKAGDPVVFFNGDGMDYIGYAEEFSKKSVSVSITDIVKNSGVAKRALTLFMGNPKGDKLELVVQKLTELGAVEIVPFTSEFVTNRSQPALPRLSRIAVEACKQCGSASIPRVTPLLDFSGVLSGIERFDAAFIAYENERGNSLIAAIDENARSVALIIGSEGGFSSAEVESAISRGAVSVSLGSRILRCETAAIAAASLVLLG